MEDPKSQEIRSLKRGEKPPIKIKGKPKEELLDFEFISSSLFDSPIKSLQPILLFISNF